MPAQAGIQGEQAGAYSYPAWIPAVAGMTNPRFTLHLHRDEVPGWAELAKPNDSRTQRSAFIVHRLFQPRLELIVHLQQPQHAGFVAAHLAAKAHHVGEHDGGQTARLSL